MTVHSQFIFLDLSKKMQVYVVCVSKPSKSGTWECKSREICVCFQMNVAFWPVTRQTFHQCCVRLWKLFRTDLCSSSQSVSPALSYSLWLSLHLSLILSDCPCLSVSLCLCFCLSLSVSFFVSLPLSLCLSLSVCLSLSFFLAVTIILSGCL